MAERLMVLDDSMQETILEIRDMVRDMYDKRGSEVMGIKEIAEEMGMSPAWVYQRPWVQPNFGQQELDGKQKKWYRRTWLAWQRNMDQHQREWESKQLTLIKGA